MKWKIIWTVALFFIYSQAEWACEYIEEIKKCSAAKANNTTREIEDFICIDKNPEMFTYQIILDAKFSKIDEKVEKYISDLEESKWYYFWKDKQKTYLDAVNNIVAIYDKTGDFGKQYYEVCNGSVLAREVIDCKQESRLSNIFWTGSTSVQIINAQKYYGESSTTCREMVNKKLAIYKRVSFDILLLNKLQVSQGEKKTYVQKQRSKYDELLSKFMINLWYIERIWAKWNVKTRNTSWGS